MISGRPLLFLLPFLVASTASAAPAIIQEDTVITSVNLDGSSTDTETTFDFTVNVVVTGTNLKLTCDRLISVSTRVTDKTATIGNPTGLKSLLAIGHVHLVQNGGTREAYCGQLEVFPKEDKIVLTHEPIVIDRERGSKATGDVLELYRNQRQVKGHNVKITFPPIKDLGFDKNDKSGGAPAAASPDSAAPAKQPE